MTTEDLKKALSQDTREKVDVNLGQVSLRSTVSRGGQYNVAVQATPKENSFTRLANAFNQLPQLAGQFKNIQQQAGVEKVQGMSPEEIKAELTKRAENGDEEAGTFMYELFQKEAVDEELYRQILKTEVIPKLQAVEARLSNASPALMHEIMSQDDPLEAIKKQYEDAIPQEVYAMVQNYPHQTALHNEMLRRIPGLSGKTHATLIEKQQEFTETSTLDNIISTDDSGAFTDNEQLPFPVDDNGEIPPLPGDPVPDFDFIEGPGVTLLPSSQPFQVEQEDPITNTPKPKLPRVPDSNPKIRPATLQTFEKKPESDLNSLEQFMMGEVDYVSVAGNPAQMGADSILSEVTLVDETGKAFNLENVPIKVEESASKTTPEGVFKLVSEGRLQPSGDGSYIKDGTDGQVAKDTKPVKLTPEQQTDLSRNTVRKERLDIAKSLNSTDNSKYTRGLEAIQKGIFRKTDEQKLRRLIEGKSLGNLEANIQENLQEVDTFLEQVKAGKLTLNGKRYSDEYITKLQRIVDTEDRRQEYADEPFGEELAEAKKVSLAKKLVSAQKEGLSAEEFNDYLGNELVNAYNLYANSQIGEAERDDLISEIEKLRELGSRFELDDDNVDFYALTDNRRAIFSGLGAADLKAKYTAPDAIVAQWEQLGKDVSGLKVTKEDDWGNTANEAWNKMLFAAPLDAWQKANERAERAVIKEFASRGYKEGRVFDLTNAEGETVGIRQYYRDLVEKYYMEEADKISEETLAKLRTRANEFRGEETLNDLEKQAGITILDSEARRTSKLNKALENKYGSNDLVNEKGKIIPTLEDETKEQSLDRFNVTIDNAVAREAMFKTNPSWDQRQPLIEQMYRKTTTDGYFLDQAFQSAVYKRDQQWDKLDSHVLKVVERSKNLGLPMEVHRNNAQIKYKGIAKEGKRRKGVPAVTLNLNPISLTPEGRKTAPLYSRKSTPKTHIYSYYAAREGSYNVFTKLDELFDLYFKGGSEAERLQFRKDQVELARKIGFGKPADETNNN